MSESQPRVEDVTEQVEKKTAEEHLTESVESAEQAKTTEEQPTESAEQAEAGPKFYTLPQMTAVLAGICAQNNITLQSDDLVFFRNMAIVSSLNQEHERGVPFGSATISTEAQVLINPARLEELAKLYLSYRNLFVRYRA